MKNLFSQIDIATGNINILDGNVPGLEAECISYESKIKAVGGIDLLVGGIRSNGHIAFNEPGSYFVSRTRVRTLTLETMITNSWFFGSNVKAGPKCALSVSVGTVMEASRFLLCGVRLEQYI